MIAALTDPSTLVPLIIPTAFICDSSSSKLRFPCSLRELIGIRLAKAIIRWTTSTKEEFARRKLSGRFASFR
jgi:hypothetical protein